MTEKKADPEFIATEEQEDPPVKLSWRQRVSILGILRMIVGQVRDSSGRPNNILGLLYVAIVFMGAGIWWGTHPAPVKYELDLKLNGQKATQVKKAKRKRIRSIKNGVKAAEKALKKGVKNLISGPQTARSQIRTYQAPGATIRLDLTLQPPQPLPASFWWVLLLLVVGFLGAYLGRHPRMRQWIKNILLAYRSVNTNGSVSFQEKVAPFVRGFLDGGKDADGPKDVSPGLPPQKQLEDDKEPIIDEKDLPERDH